MDIGEAFLSSKSEPIGSRQETCYLTRWLPYSLAEFRQALSVSMVRASASLLGIPRMLRSA
jgi:hypothetical protein